MSAEENYLSALDRLERDEPEILPKGTFINNDTVALEAGRKRGSIKNLRYPDLCKAIVEAAKRQQAQISAIRVSSVEGVTRSDEADKALKEKYKTLERDYKIALQKNISLVYEVFTLRKKVSELEQKQVGRVVDFPRS